MAINIDEEIIIEAGISYTLATHPNCLGGALFEEEMREWNRNRAFEEGAKWALKQLNN